MNEQNITENGLLTAFNQVQTGQTSPLMEQMFRGLNVGGQVVNGTTWTATQALLAATQTRTFFANNNVGGFANYLNNTDNFVGTRGGLLRRASLPENWIVVSPQFASSRLTSNFGSSTYHSMQLEWTKRFSGGWTVQSNYTLAKALGEEEGAGQEQLDSYRTLRNRSLDKRLMSFSVHHVTRTNAIYELPFGKGRQFASGVNKWVDGLIGGWQLGGIFNTFSGDPLAVNSSGALALGTWNNLGDNTAVALQPLNNQLGQAVRTGNGVVYFQGLTQGPDPQIARLSPTIRSLSQMQSISTADGQLLLTNPVPGQLGTLAPRSLYGPGSFRLDMNLIKRIRVTERISAEINITAENVSNTPQFGNPVTDINDLNFGRITGAGGVRVMVIGARVSF
jgi:hypothetical protein